MTEGLYVRYDRPPPRLFPLLALSLGLVLSACAGRPADIALDPTLEETDRSLFESAKADLERGEFARARLLFETLIGTYPDSEYVPQAMYAIAESYYQTGTRADMMQASAEFDRFQTFFPTDGLADDAQMMRAMTHILQMEKSDRDPTEALLAEQELEGLIARYPGTDLGEEARVKLRAVQNVIARHITHIGNHYFTVGAYLPALGRYEDVLEQYPDYVGISEVFYRMGEIYRRAGDPLTAAEHYTEIVRNHPSSDFDKNARERLEALDLPIPEVNPAALARLEAQPEPPVRSLASRMFGILGGGPGISTDTTAASILVDNPEESESGTGEFSVDGVILEEGSPPGGS
jgi:outer membrane protein assembly factor BamD